MQHTIATVGGVYSDGLSLIFPGETSPSAKHYKCNTSATFSTGDRVKLFYDSGTYIVEYPIGTSPNGAPSGRGTGGGSGGGTMDYKTLFPIGFCITSFVLFDPNTVYPGTTWERVKDVFLLAAGDEYPINTSGGEAEHSLTTAEMPTHSHGVGTLAATLTPAKANKFTGYMMRDKGSTSASGEYAASGSSSAKGFALDTEMNISISGFTGVTGTGSAFNIMPPYKTVYAWKRIA